MSCEVDRLYQQSLINKQVSLFSYTIVHHPCWPLEENLHANKNFYVDNGKFHNILNLLLCDIYISTSFYIITFFDISSKNICCLFSIFLKFFPIYCRLKDNATENSSICKETDAKWLRALEIFTYVLYYVMHAHRPHLKQVIINLVQHDSSIVIVQNIIGTVLTCNRQPM